MLIFGLKGDLVRGTKAVQALEFASNSGNYIARGLDSKPFLPADYWEEWASSREDVTAFPDPVEFNCRISSYMWEPSLRFLTDSVPSTAFIYNNGTGLCAVIPDRDLQKFKENTITSLRDRADQGTLNQEGIGAAISLFGKEPALVALWKLCKAF